MPNQLPFILLFLFTNISCIHQEFIGTSTIIPETEDNVADIGTSEPDNSSEEKLVLLAKVIGVVDGDTVDVLYHDLPLRIRMEHIDAPEKRGNQPYGNKAKLMISQLCFGQRVKILTAGDFDMGGRLIAEIINEDGINVNMEMVKQGYAWHFKKYSNEMSYDHLETEARKAHRGLWQDKNPIAPWDFRKR
jgi:endonuclease YncB( thermonuclease family)